MRRWAIYSHTLHMTVVGRLRVAGRPDTGSWVTGFLVVDLREVEDG